MFWAKIDGGSNHNGQDKTSKDFLLIIFLTASLDRGLRNHFFPFSSFDYVNYSTVPQYAEWEMNKSVKDRAGTFTG